jgi:lysophospholipase L1-like esterase
MNVKLLNRNTAALLHLLAGVIAALGLGFGFISPALEGSAAFAVEAKKFEFTSPSGQSSAGAIRVTPTMIYTAERGYGFEPGAKVKVVDRGVRPGLRSFCTSDKPFFFSVALPEGNYDVAVWFGEPGGASTNTVKAESRRLMLENVQTAPGEFVKRTFTVNVRTPRLPNGGQVRLKPRELGPPLVLHWDDKLTLEFNGARPCVSSIEITPANDAITVFLAGDSTVTDQPLEPWNSWGQMLPRFLKQGVAVANHAESGESLPSFLGAKRLDKVLSAMKSGDYLFIQFGHNDQKDKRPGAGAFTTYKTNLVRFITEARQRGGLPVLVTPMERKAGVAQGTLGDFPDAVRQVASEQNVPLIDLNAMSKTTYAALGATLDRAFQDGTHHNNYGSYELARCVVTGFKANNLGLAKFLTDDALPFDPAHPDPIDAFNVPASPLASSEKPEGN